MGAPVNTAAAKLPSLTFTWTAPPDYGSAIYNYKGEMKRLDTNAVNTWTALGTEAVPQTALSKTFLNTDGVGLNAGRRYQFRIQAQNATGTSAWSPWSSILTA